MQLSLNTMPKHFLSVFFISAFVLGALPLSAQDYFGNNPYSANYFGEFLPIQNSRSLSMANTGVAGGSISNLNLKNPALLSLNARTNIEMGWFGSRRTLSSSSSDAITGGGGLNNLSIGFPVWRDKIGKRKRGWAHTTTVALSLTPFSAKNYQSVIESEQAGLTTQVLSDGNGVANRLSLQVGSVLTRNLKVGMSAKYFFGRLEDKAFLRIPLEDTFVVDAATRTNIDKRLNGFDYNLGATYDWYFKRGIERDSLGRATDRTTYAVTLGGVVSGQGTMGVDATTSFGQVYFVSNGLILPSFFDSTGANLIRQEPDTLNKVNQTFTMAPGFQLGLSIAKDYDFGQNVYWQVNLEGGFRDYSGLNDRGRSLEHSMRTYGALGLEVIPYLDFNWGYLNLINYRAGLRYEQLPFTYNNTQIQSLGINFGLGLPLTTKGSMGQSSDVPYVNLFGSYQNWNTPANGIAVRSFYFGAGLVINDAGWFFKRTYN